MKARYATRYPRRQVIYVRDDEQALWQDAADCAHALGLPLSVLVAQALRQYKPLRRHTADRERAGTAA
jgi:hypothetical protein